MQFNFSINPSKVNTFVVKHPKKVLHVTKQNNRKPLYAWATQLFFNHIITATLLHTLKAIIACNELSMPTLAQISAARTRSVAGRFAQDDVVCEKTISRHIKILCKLGLIKCVTVKEGWYSRNLYTICAPKENLVDQRGDIMSPSICYTKIINNIDNPNPYKNDEDFDNKLSKQELNQTYADYLKQRPTKFAPKAATKNKKAELKTVEIFNMNEILDLPKNHMAKSLAGAVKKIQETSQVVIHTPGYATILANFTESEKHVYEQLVELKVYKRLALKWIRTYTLAQLSNLIEATKIYGAKDPWSYIHVSLRELVAEEQKAKLDPIILKPWEPGAKMSKSNKETAIGWIAKMKNRVPK